MFGECVDAPVSISRQERRRAAAAVQAARQGPAPAPTAGEQAALLSAQTTIDLSLLQKVPPELLQGLSAGFLRRAMIGATAALQDGRKFGHDSDNHAEGGDPGAQALLEESLAKSIMMLPLATRLPLLNKWGPAAIAAAGFAMVAGQPPDDAASGLVPAAAGARSFYDFGPAEAAAKDLSNMVVQRGVADNAKAKEKDKARRREKGLAAAFAAEGLTEEQPGEPAPPPEEQGRGGRRRRAEAKMFLEGARTLGPSERESITAAKREQDAKKAALGVLGNFERNKAAAEEASRVSRAAGRPAPSGGPDAKQADGSDAGGWTSAPPARIFTEAGTAVARDAGGHASRAAAAEDRPSGWAFGRSRSRDSHDRDRDRDRGWRRSTGTRSESPPPRDSARGSDRISHRQLAGRAGDGSRSRGRGSLGARSDREGSRRRGGDSGARDRSPRRRPASSDAAPGDRKAPVQPEPNPDAFLRQLGVRNGWAEFVNEKTGEKVFKNVLTGERTNRMPTDYHTSISDVMNRRRLNWLAGQKGGGYATMASGVRPPGM